jgi:hypothetical protein
VLTRLCEFGQLSGGSVPGAVRSFERELYPVFQQLKGCLLNFLEVVLFPPKAFAEVLSYYDLQPILHTITFFTIQNAYST